MFDLIKNVIYYLSNEQKQKFDQDGYLVIPNFFSLETAEKLKLRAHQLLGELSLDDHPMTIFSADEKENINYLYLNEREKAARLILNIIANEEAFDESGKLKLEKSKAINKIGHGIEKRALTCHYRCVIVDLMEFSLKNESIHQIAKTLGFKNPQILQSMLIFKQPYIGARVRPHQDSTFLYTKPLSAIGFWFALEDSHPIGSRFVRAKKADGKLSTEFIQIDNEVSYDESQFVLEECKAGTLVLIHGSVLHKSEANRSGRSRFIYTFHVIEGTAEYDERNWLQPTKEIPFKNKADFSILTQIPNLRQLGNQKLVKFFELCKSFERVCMSERRNYLTDFKIIWFESDYQEEKQQELEVLRSIYPDELEEISADEYKIKLEPDDQDTLAPVTIALHIKYTHTYPDEIPEISIDTLDGSLSPEDHDKLLDGLLNAAQESLGMVMEEQARFQGTKVTVASFLEWREKFNKEKAEKERIEKGTAAYKRDEAKKLKATGRQLFEQDATLAKSDATFMEEGDVTVDTSLFEHEDLGSDESSGDEEVLNLIRMASLKTKLLGWFGNSLVE
ncbi:1953_t:CDS:10 [Ambispora gerdemannii]|uniref:1953_t:CDS:1 n=1 Tax=Ambispora gerdemannii TaxID=144530 RepID=A0A9N8Z8M9_9GLOM|nr:1953_t:CDS:10 [Ambispora gerdemannii]